MSEKDTIFEQPLESFESNEEILTEVTGTRGFVFMEPVDTVLNIALDTHENVILFGPGGFGKSEYTLAFLKEKGIEPFIQTMGSGMTIDRLFGGMDLALFQETGKLEYLVENSFMAHEYCVFEELFDAPDFILEQLKDILSSGYFRNGNQIYKLKTKLIICCTNRTRTEFAKDASLKALMERFPLEYEVKWKDYNDISYSKLLMTKYGVTDQFLTYIFSEYAANNIIISPRIATKAFKIVKRTETLESLQFIAEFAQNPKVLQTARKTFESRHQLIQLKEDYDKIKSQIQKAIKETDLTSAESLIQELGAVSKKFGKLTLTDNMIKDVENIKKQITSDMDQFVRQLELLQQSQL